MGPELVQSTGWAKTAVRSSLVPHVVLLMFLMVENASSWFGSGSKKQSVKADLAIYRKVLGVSGKCISVVFMY